MTEHAVTHATFTIERTYPASAARVFAALSDPVAKAIWFTGPPGWEPLARSMDFRIGGREHLTGDHGDGQIFTFDAEYRNIVPNERIIYVYAMTLGGRPISVSLATLVLTPSGSGTKLSFTEQGAFLDGFDDAGSRERGTRDLLDKLGASLR